MRLTELLVAVEHYGLDFKCTDVLSSKLPTPVATGSEKLSGVMKAQPQNITVSCKMLWLVS